MKGRISEIKIENKVLRRELRKLRQCFSVENPVEYMLRIDEIQKELGKLANELKDIRANSKRFK